MANRRMVQFAYSFEQKPVTLYAKVAIGASGAPTLSSSYSKGITSITRNSAGTYTVVLADNYTGILGVKHVFANSTAPAAPLMFVKADNVAAAAHSVQVVFTAVDGTTATDPGNGETMYLEFVLRNSQY